jgi:hypothetical protein
VVLKEEMVGFLEAAGAALGITIQGLLLLAETGQ